MNFKILLLIASMGILATCKPRNGSRLSAADDANFHGAHKAQLEDIQYIRILSELESDALFLTDEEKEAKEKAEQNVKSFTDSVKPILQEIKKQELNNQGSSLLPSTRSAFESLKAKAEKVEAEIKKIKGEAEPQKNTAPVPAGCDESVWALDARWSTPNIHLLQQFMTSSNDIRVQAEAMALLVTLSRNHSLVCADEYFEELLPQFQGVQGDKICDSYARCGVATALLGTLTETIPESEALNVLFGRIESDVKALEEQNAAKVLRFKIASLRAHKAMYAAIGFGKGEKRGQSLVLSQAERDSLKAEFAKVKADSTKELFLTNQMQGTYIRNPGIAKRMIREQLLPGVKFSSLSQEVQDALVEEAVGVFESAWYMQIVNEGFSLYIDRFVNADPRPWLADVERRAKLWSSQEDAIDLDGFELAEAPAGVANGNALLVNPRVALQVLAGFSDREGLLPWRRQWSESAARLFQLIPPGNRDGVVNANYQKTAYMMPSWTQKILSDYVQKARINDEKAPDEQLLAFERMLISLEYSLASEAGLAAYFSGYKSVYSELAKLFEAMSTRALLVHNIAERYKKQQWFSGWVSEEERLTLISRTDEVSLELVRGWLKLSCLPLIYERSQNKPAQTKISEKFYMDQSITLDFECMPETSGVNPADAVGLERRILAYTESAAFKRGYDNRMAKVREYSFLAATLAASFPLSLTSYIGSTRVMWAAETIGALRAGSYLAARQWMVQGAAMAGSLAASAVTFNALASLHNAAFDRVAGIQSNVPPEFSASQYLYHNVHTMGIFASLSVVGYLSRGAVGLAAGMLARRAAAGGSAAAGASGAAATGTALGPVIPNAGIPNAGTALGPVIPEGVLKPSMARKFAEFTVGLTAEAGMFLALPYVSEVGAEVLGMNAHLTETQKYYQKLYMPGWDAHVRDSVGMAAMFRTSAALHREAWASNAPPEHGWYKEAVKGEAGGGQRSNSGLNSKQAAEILGLDVVNQEKFIAYFDRGVGDAKEMQSIITSAYRKRIRMYFPDQIELVNRRLLEELGLPREAADRIIGKAKLGDEFAVAQKEWSIPAKDIDKVEAIYKKVSDAMLYVKTLSNAKDFVVIDKNFSLDKKF